MTFVHGLYSQKTPGLEERITPLEDIAVKLDKTPLLSPRQVENVTLLMQFSSQFCKEIKNPCPHEVEITPQTIVLESGHQPNFLPHIGTWKKAFLLHCVLEKMKQRERPSIAFFGFADLNLSTARLLYRNHIPALNKAGSKPVGFRIDDQDIYRTFSSLDKPSRERWQKEMENIREHYLAGAKRSGMAAGTQQTQVSELMEILDSCYRNARNFSELNEAVFAKICSEFFNMSLCFYSYADIRKNKIFLMESKQILRNVSVFNEIYNTTIQEKKLKLAPVPHNHLPFWFTCDCGKKYDMRWDESKTVTISCSRCNREHQVVLDDDFTNLDRFFERMDFNAVSRNLVLAQGLGIGLQITGSGGSLEYGEISHRISEKLLLHEPQILRWRSRDYYIGIAHAATVEDSAKTVQGTPRDFLNCGFCKKFKNSQQELSEKISETERAKGESRELKNQKNNLVLQKNQEATTRTIFSMVPSAIDIFVHHKPATIILAFDQALSQSRILWDNHLGKLEGDVIYPQTLLPDISASEIPDLYRSIEERCD